MGHTAGHHHGVAPQGALSLNAGDQYSGEFALQIRQMQMPQKIIESANRGRICGVSMLAHVGINSKTRFRLRSIVPLNVILIVCGFLYFLQAITQDKQDLRNMYECPVYKTRTRGPSTYVSNLNLKTKDKPGKWILAGVALLLQT